MGEGGEGTHCAGGVGRRRLLLLHLGLLKQADGAGVGKEVVELLIDQPESPELRGRLGAIVGWSVRATKQAARTSPEDLEALREQGLDDEEILEVAGVVSHFNHLDRVLDALGVVAPWR